MATLDIGRARALALLSVAAVVLAGLVPGVAQGSDPARHRGTDSVPAQHPPTSAEDRESFLYVAAINGGNDGNPDFLAVIGADPKKPHEYGRIISRVDLGVGDNVHHFGYSLDQERLLVPGLFSSGMHVLDVSNQPKHPRLVESRDDLVADSGYRAPHTVTALREREVLVSMLGADTATSGPGGVVVLDDRTGQFLRHFGPAPTENAEPDYMYDLAFKPALNRAVSTTWGYPDHVFEFPFAPNGDEVAVWDIAQEKVIQTESLGPNAGALELDWLHAEKGDDSRRGYLIASNGLWLWEDDDQNGHLDFHLVAIGLSVPCDMMITPDDGHLFVANWGSDTVQLYDISNRYKPELIAERTVPHPCMMRLSPDGERLYVTNSVVLTLDDDPVLGPNNDQYGIWQFDVNSKKGKFQSVTTDGSAWVDFTDVQKKHTTGPAGPHMILFDPGVTVEPGHH